MESLSVIMCGHVSFDNTRTIANEQNQECGEFSFQQKTVDFTFQPVTVES